MLKTKFFRQKTVQVSNRPLDKDVKEILKASKKFVSEKSVHRS